jgi:FlaA1/EpsC-like NDP-sugar epimerase
MSRYFMTIPEACQLVLQAGTMGAGGEIFILDMGEPVRISDLASDLIRLSGFRVGEDIEIVYTGVRPGEKLFEELAVEEELVGKTKHPKIFVGQRRCVAGQDVFEVEVSDLLERVDWLSDQRLREALVRLVPEYTGGSPSTSGALPRSRTVVGAAAE